MAILYGIKKVILTELDPSTGEAKANGTVATIKTAEEAELEPVISEGDEEILRSDELILATVRTDDLLYGYNVKFKDNTFSEDVAALVAGYKVAEVDDKTTISTPMLSEGNLSKPFKMDIYVANYKGDDIVNYTLVTLNKCKGTFPTMKVGKEYFSPEFEIKARENTKASLPIKSINFVDTLPADPS